MSRYAKEKYPWDECIKDQLEQYGDQEIAEKVCGKIKAQSQSKSASRIASRYLQSSRMKSLMMEIDDSDEAWDYLHDSPIDRRTKAQTFIRALVNGVPLSREQKSSIVDAQNALTYATGGDEPFDVIPEKSRRLIRHLAYRNERKLMARLPLLPAGIVYKDEIRRLFGS